MADLTKLTKLEALQQLAQRVNQDFTKKKDFNTLKNRVDQHDTDISGLQDTVGNLQAAGGEQNTIVKIKVNGEDQTIGEDRSVNITVPTDNASLTNGAGYQTASDVKSAADSAATSAINEWAKQVTEDNETVDTFKELIDYVAKHAPEAASMAASIEELEKLVGEDSVSEQIKEALDGYVQKDGSKKLSTEDYTTEEKEKLSKIDLEANKYIHPTSDAGAVTSDLYKIATDADGHITAVVKVAKEDILGLGIPGQDTTYEVVSSESNGLMSSTDKDKLDGMTIATDGEVTEVLNGVLGVPEE